MAKDITNFHKDLNDPLAGTKSDLYNVIEPTISIDDESDLQPTDLDRIKFLKEKIRQGLVGAEYLSGLKKNKVKTFYDEHPVQAVAGNVLKNSPMLGAAIAAGGIGLNAARQHRNFSKTEPGYYSRREDPKGENPYRKLYPEKGKVDPDTLRLFGTDKVTDLTENSIEEAARRMGKLDQATGSIRATSLLDKFQPYLDHIAQEKERFHAFADSPQADPATINEWQNSITEMEKTVQKNLNAAIGSFRGSPEAQRLNEYVALQESLLKQRAAGEKLTPYLGESLHGKKTGIPALDKILEKVTPTPGMDYGDLFYKRLGHYSDELPNSVLAREILTDTLGHSETKRVLPGVQKALSENWKTNGLGRALEHTKFPLAVGGAVAAGGMGLYGLLKLIQNQIYSKSQRDEWRKNILKSRGEFEEANKIQ